MSRFVQYDEFGDRTNLKVIEVAEPIAEAGQVRVRVKAAGLNPVDYKIYHGGPAAEAYGATVPSGVGNDFAGVIDQVGDGVAGFLVGDKVLGSARNLAEADYVVVPVAAIVAKPEGLSFEVAGSLAVVGRTAWASVRSLDLTEGDTVLVSAAAGGVGVLAVQLALRAGATVVGTSSAENHDFLASLGVIPVAYGDGLVERLREAAPGGFTAALDNHGPQTIDAAIELGVPVGRINTIATHGPAARGVTSVGGSEASNADLEHMAQLLADAEIVLPIDSVFPLERVVDAYAKLEGGHLRGKIVLVTE